MNRSELQLRLDELADEFLQRRYDGENPTIEQITNENPDISTPLRQYLKTILMVDDIRDESQFKNNPNFNPTQQSDTFPILDDYEIVREIGRGGMGIVYEAHHLSLDRTVALKVLPSGLFQNQGAVKRFQLEAKSAARLHHTNIVPIFDVDQKDEVCYYAMQFIEGQSLDFVVNELGKLVDGDSEDVAEKDSALSDTMKLGMSSTTAGRQPFYQNVARIGKQAGEALHHAHENGIVHRDIKPANLMLDFSGTIWVMDFGLAKTDESNLTQTGDVVGTLRYMSPKRFAGQCDRRSDVYSLGMTLYELLIQKPAFGNSDRLSLIDSFKTAAPDSLRRIDRNIPRDLETIVEKAIEKDPRRRYLTAGEMSADLSRFMAGQPIHARRVGNVERLWLWSKKRKALAASLAALLLLLTVGTIASAIAATHYRDIANRNLALAESNAEKTEAAVQATRRAENKTAEANNALDKAETFGKRAAESLELFTSAFASASPLQNAEAGVDMQAKDILINALAELEGSTLDDEGQEAFLKSLSNSFVDLGEYDLALDASLKRLDKLEQIYDLRDPKFPPGTVNQDFVPEVDLLLDAKRSIAECYGLKGDYATCEKIYQENFDFSVEHCAIDDQRRIDATGYLANAFIKLEDWEAAVPLLESAIEENEKRHGNVYQGEAALKNNLAVCLSAIGEFEPAIELFEEMLELHQTKDAAASLNTKSALAGC